MTEELDQILELIQAYGGFMYGCGQLDVNLEPEKIADRSSTAIALERKIEHQLRELFK